MEGLAFCLVFCSTLAALVSVIPVLCSMMSIPNMRGYYGDPLTSHLSVKLHQQGPTLVLPFAFQKPA
jgi:hypothetical protein